MTFISQSTTYSHNTGIQMLAALAAYAGRLLSEAAQRRRIRNSIGHLPEKYLRDIGLTEHDVSSATKLPLPFSSARELSATTKTRAGNW